jgi:Tol biopolymer transport system component
MEINHEEARTMKSKLILSAMIAAILALALSSAGQQSAEQLYKAGLYEEEVGGDLQKAIGIYQDILKKFTDNREIAAMAQLHIGLCHEKLGTKEAEKAFQKVIDNYPEQSEAVREAKEKLSLLSRSRALMKTGTAEFSLRQVWSGSGVDITGAVSPDGRYLSFVDWETGDLAIRDLTSGTNRRLTNKGSWTQSQEFALFSEWAPDSRRIVYQWYNKEEIFDLRVIDIKNSTSRILYRNQRQSDYVQAFDWSPDGNHVLAAIYSEQAPAGGRSIELGLISAEDGTVTLLKTNLETRSMNPEPWGFVLSPDGKTIAYDITMEDKPNLKRDIMLLPVEGGQVTPLIDHPAYDTVIDWTPNGKGLLFLSDRTGSEGVWFVRFEGRKAQGDPQLIKSGAGPIESLGMTSAGKLFYGLQGGATDVYKVEIDPRTGKILTPAKKVILQNEGHNGNPDYSPDGKFLAYISSPSMPNIQPRETLNIFSLETGQPRALKPALTRFSDPRWSPDGRALSVAGVDQEGRGGIYSIDVQTSGVVPIVQIEKGMESHSHCWSRDGKLLFYTLYRRIGRTSSIFIHNFETGRDEKLSGSPDDADDIDISPDGKWLVLLNSNEKRVLRIMPTSGGDPRLIYSFDHGENYKITPTWSADGRYIYFTKQQGAGSIVWDLYRVPSDGGEAQKMDLNMAQLRHFSVHPDGRHIAFSSMGLNPELSQVWVMENFLPVEKANK